MLLVCLDSNCKIITLRKLTLMLLRFLLWFSAHRYLFCTGFLPLLRDHGRLRYSSALSDWRR
jgi:hypothetical protein